jgi:pSer/pThr/pTyr-binding forkhead associated (FHA) protein
MRIALRVVGAAADGTFDLTMPDVEGYILGRSDSQNPAIPDVDLMRFSARERGVSRRHAALIAFDDKLQVLDLDSSNGTFVNGIRALPEEPLPLADGDKLMLGELEIVINLSQTSG